MPQRLEGCRNSRLSRTGDELGRHNARYQSEDVVVEIRSGEVTGGFPPRALRLLSEWTDLHREELEENWLRAREHRDLLQVEPLP